MKTLCLIRHAKSSWHDPAMDDKQRPLDERGELDAKVLGDFLKAKKLTPDIILCSPAIRTAVTAEIVARELGLKADQVIANEEIYEAGVETLLAVIQQLPKKYSTVFLVGHNPGLTWLANYLADDHMINLPTCGTYCVTFDTSDWKEITMVEGKTLFIDTPQQHGD